MTLRLGDFAPDFGALTTHGPINFHQWIGESWCMFFSHPKDFTPVCTTELGTVARLMPDFVARNVKVIGLSVDDLDSHTRWKKDIEETQRVELEYPLIADSDLTIAKAYGMIPMDEVGDASERTAADNHTARTVYIIGPDKRIKAMVVYPMSTGRNFTELLRIVDSLQLTVAHKVATPANWNKGDDVIILPAIKDEEAKRLFPRGWAAVKPYLRFVTDPT